ncbi:MAG: type IV pilin N-terminal domain-containing protein [Methanoregula sp.]|uniref:type IV pilin n=1 Tax=Methanoregula sp. TaxID=2052170 RepID=UPI003BAFD064
MYTRKNEEAVSPVIGVILMVAITVILAAVIAAFVFGMAGNIQKTKVVAATEYRVNGTYVSVTYQGGQDAGTMGGIAFTVDGANSSLVVSTGQTNIVVGLSPQNNAIFPAAGSTVLPVGASISIPAGNPGKNHVVGTGIFTDGTTQVIVDTTL